MPRVGRKSDWSLTLALQVDLTELPPWLEQYLESDDVTRYVAVAEKAKHWHIHVGFSTYREYCSDYKDWFVALCKDDPRFYNANKTNKKGKVVGGLNDISVRLTAHTDILQLVGGYCTKGDDTQFLGNKGFTAEQIELGRTLYDKSLKRKRIRDAADRLVSIPREQFDAHVGMAMAEIQAEDEGKAIEWLIDAGFAFSSSLPQQDRVRAVQRYRGNYERERLVRAAGGVEDPEERGLPEVSEDILVE